ncbi:uncharacterized protein TNIN_14001 [Trichonephila inaurata madagascariensis]|uniref:Chromo domain-containing protein n=1 Tax=Trichonephila inaurata madagascariensis TaxID=2747483 RepID=A0A8X6WWI8_9ARAC|nr:uncharacterized protein TNIN_14001 [Trichonephila inaurata madagascariensis]
MVDTEPKLFLLQEDVYEVEKLVAVKIVKGQKLYRVRWRGYGKDSDTLEPEENLLSCKDMILDLEKKIRERHQKRKNKKLFKPQICTKELRSSKNNICSRPFPSSLMESDFMRVTSDCNKIWKDASTWQATEVHPSGTNSKDTFWRDFDEGKISVSGTVYDKDMYSKVKERAERAARTINLSEGHKNLEIAQKENPMPPLCPKVVLKRKPVNRTSSESLMYKSSFKVKPMGLQIRKRKKYDVLRDYRKRKSRIHRKRNLDENGQRKMIYRNSDKSDHEYGQNSSNILQELLINEELKSSVLPDYVLNSSKSDSCGSKVKDMRIKLQRDSTCEEMMKGEGRKNSLMCKISMQDAMKSYNQGMKKDERNSSHRNSTNMDATIRKVFSSMIDAVVNDHLEKVERLCKNNCVINCCQEDGTTALMVASQLGHYFATKALLKANAHKDKQNKRGETALMMACKNGHAQIAKLLLEHGANFALTNAEGINVLRIVNQYASQPKIHDILIEHIVKVVSQFESSARLQVRHIAQIKYALFPIQCFSLNEGPKYSIYFHHHVKLESPEKNGNQNLLFIARTTINTSSVLCQFDTDTLVHHISINGVKQDLFSENISSVFKVTGLKNGSNKVSIATAHYPESELKLIVCAYKVHRSMLGFPTQKLKSE